VKKLLVGTMITAGTMFMGAQLASATTDYPITDPGDGSVAALPPVTPTSPGTPSTGGTPGALPSTGGDSMMLLQLGLVTVAAGGTIVSAAALRRRRFTES
jgi:hypothetical protein